jgi:hypothetical protein
MSFYKIDGAKVLHELFDNEAVLINLESGRYYSLEGVAAVIWRLLSQGASQSEILLAVEARFTGDKSLIAHDTVEFLNDLVQEDLVAIDPQPRESLGASREPAAAAVGHFIKPVLQKYSDMQELLLFDPIHQVDEKGWPNVKAGKL